MIPADALIQPADLAGSQQLRGGDFREFAHLSPPDPCRAGPLPRDAVRLAAARMLLSVLPGTPGRTPTLVFTQVGRYRDGGGARLLADVAQGARRCPGPAGENRTRLRLIEQSGDRLLLHGVTQRAYGNESLVHTTVVGVVHAGDITVVVADISYVASSGTDVRVRELLEAAPPAGRRLTPVVGSGRIVVPFATIRHSRRSTSRYGAGASPVRGPRSPTLAQEPRGDHRGRSWTVTTRAA